MIVVNASQRREHRAADSVCVYEYDMPDPDLGGAVAVISGRYPQTGFVQNLKVKQLAYVLSGSGQMLTPGLARPLAAGDMVFIDVEESFAWDGAMELFLANAPRFDPAQYRQVD